jgi:hypothetical protein
MQQLRIERPADKPVMAKRIDNPSLPEAPRFVGNRKYLGRSGADGTTGHRMGICDEQANSYATASERPVD